MKAKKNLPAGRQGKLKKVKKIKPDKSRRHFDGPVTIPAKRGLVGKAVKTRRKFFVKRKIAKKAKLKKKVFKKKKRVTRKIEKREPASFPAQSFFKAKIKVIGIGGG